MPASGAGLCRIPEAAVSGTSWRWEMWISRSSAATRPFWTVRVPVRQVLEQIVAKTSIPPFMLGLNWNSTERMSAQQADMLTTEITAIRRTLTPVVEQICRMWLRMQGETAAFRVDWEDINLQDEVEEAKAELYREQARKLRIENDVAEGKIEDRAAGAAKKA